MQFDKQVHYNDLAVNTKRIWLRKPINQHLLVKWKRKTLLVHFKEAEILPPPMSLYCANHD